MDWKDNIYKENKFTGAFLNPFTTKITPRDEAFAAEANEILCKAVELVRQLIPSHQSAVTIVVEKDWATVRKFFSLSYKYSDWKHYAVPAVGHGIHNYILHYNKPIRLTQHQLEAHPHWGGMGGQADKHPPMRGWLATPIIDNEGKNWGLIQLSDKLDGEYSEEDEKLLVDFTEIISRALALAWSNRNLKEE